jgi:hypothetical protein
VFQLLFDRRHNVLMTRLHGTYVEADIALRDKAVGRFVARHGAARGIMDFSDVEAVEVPIEAVVRRAERPSLLGGQARVIVAPHEPLWALNRIFAAHQLYRSGTEPLLVRSLAEAHRAFGIAKPAFFPLELDPASRLETVAAGVLAGISRARGAVEAAQQERTRRTMLRLLDEVMTRPPAAPKAQAITLSDVLNAVLDGATVSDADLRTTCRGCKVRRPLSRLVVAAGRETTYACAACGQVMIVLATAKDCSKGASPAYEIGRFFVRTSGDIDCPGAILPKSEP